MSRRHAGALVLGLWCLSAQAQTTAPAVAAQATEQSAEQSAEPAAAPEPVPATVVIEGRRPGPGVWKVSKGDHVMWVFGTYSPLPRNLAWDASRIERLVARSQEVLLPPAAKGDVGFFRGLTLLPSLIGFKKNPDDARLADLVPADVYARWTVLKAKYIGNDDGVERDRPIFAGEQLLHAGMKQNGLSSSREVLATIEGIAKKNNVKVSPSGFSLKLDDPRKMIKDFKKSRVDDVACFTRTLDTLDSDIAAMRERANAWADGNIANIRSVNFAEREDACNDAILNGSFASSAPEFQHLPERLREAWLRTAEKSLADNTSTFAVLQIKDIVDPKGYLAALQARGYTVESPK
jgi:hypothetical protein